VSPAVEVVDRGDPARLAFDRVRIAEVPAAAIVAQDDLGSPRLPLVFADAGTHAIGRQAIAINADPAPVLHLDEAAGCAEIVDAREEVPRCRAVIAVVQLGPHHAGRITL